MELEKNFHRLGRCGLNKERNKGSSPSRFLVKKRWFVFNFAFTSNLNRSIQTLWIILDEMDLKNIPVTKDWRLNERHLGDLQGKEIQKMEEMYGREQVDKWRKDFLTVPLEITDDNPTKNSYEENAQTPKSESYKDLQDRVLPFWKSVIVSAHQNTLRIIIKYLENIPDEDIASINVPTGTPIIYYLDPEGSVISKE